MGVISRCISLLVGIAIISQIILAGDTLAQECGGPGQPKCRISVFKTPAKKVPVKRKKTEPVPKKTPLPTPSPVATPVASPTETPSPTPAPNAAPTPKPTPINLRPLSELLKLAPKPGEIRRNSLGMELVWIRHGEFMMGSSESEVDDAFLECKKAFSECKRESFTHEMPKHKVTIRAGFWIGKYEVTQGQWQAVMGDNPSNFKDCGVNCPVEQVSWDDIQIFLRRLNAKDATYEYTLPTEAQWEYAVRAGTTTAFAYGNTLNSSQANFDGEFPFDSTKGTTVGKTAPAGRYRPNAWGLYDMHGSVWEWVQDGYDPTSYSRPSNGTPNVSKRADERVLRGGSWFSRAVDSRSAYRGKASSAYRVDYIGFRIAARPK